LSLVRAMLAVQAQKAAELAAPGQRVLAAPAPREAEQTRHQESPHSPCLERAPYLPACHSP
ncbi:MAG: hypothetical protein WA728_34200, partial [Xanthobacteraceae bacterium]